MLTVYCFTFNFRQKTRKADYSILEDGASDDESETLYDPTENERSTITASTEV